MERNQSKNKEKFDEDDDISDEEERSSSGVGMWIVLGGGLASGVAGVYWLWRYFYWEKVNTRVAEILSSQTESKDAWGQVGTMGDSFGAFSAFFAGIGVVVSAIAFLGFIYALKMQRDDLNLQRNEMKRNRKVMRRQVAIAKEQLSMATQQMLSSALPSQVELMQIMMSKAMALKSGAGDVLSACSFLVQKLYRDSLGKSRDYYYKLSRINRMLDDLTPWHNVIVMWRDKIENLDLSIDDKARCILQLAECCSINEKSIMVLLKIRSGELNFREVDVFRYIQRELNIDILAYDDKKEEEYLKILKGKRLYALCYLLSCMQEAAVQGGGTSEKNVADWVSNNFDEKVRLAEVEYCERLQEFDS